MHKPAQGTNVYHIKLASVDFSPMRTLRGALPDPPPAPHKCCDALFGRKRHVPVHGVFPAVLVDAVAADVHAPVATPVASFRELEVFAVARIAVGVAPGTEEKMCWYPCSYQKIMRTRSYLSEEANSPRNRQRARSAGSHTAPPQRPHSAASQACRCGS